MCRQFFLSQLHSNSATSQTPDMFPWLRSQPPFETHGSTKPRLIDSHIDVSDPRPFRYSIVTRDESPRTIQSRICVIPRCSFHRFRLKQRQTPCRPHASLAFSGTPTMAISFGIQLLRRIRQHRSPIRNSGSSVPSLDLSVSFSCLSLHSATCTTNVGPGRRTGKFRR